MRLVWSYFELKSGARVKPLMLDLAIAKSQDGVEDFLQNPDWCTYELDVIRGYS